MALRVLFWMRVAPAQERAATKQNTIISDILLFTAIISNVILLDMVSTHIWINKYMALILERTEKIVFRLGYK